MAKFIKINKVLHSNCSPVRYYEDENLYEYIRPRDVCGIIHRDNVWCAKYKTVDDKETESTFYSNITTITRYNGCAVDTLMDTDEVMELINTALEEEEHK